MQPPKDNSEDQLLAFYIQSPSAKPQVKKLMSENDDEFAEGLIQILPTQLLQVSRVQLSAVIKVPSGIKNIIIERVVERVKKIIRQSTNLNLLRKVLERAMRINEKNILQAKKSIQNAILQTLLIQSSFKKFQILLSHFSSDNIQPEQLTQLVNVLEKAKDIETVQSSKQFIQQRFKNIQTKQQIKYTKFIGLLYLSKFSKTFIISFKQIEELLAQFKLQRNQNNQKLLKIAIKQNIPSVCSMIQSIMETKVFEDTKKQELINQQLHQSFITKQNVIFFFRELCSKGNKPDIDSFIGTGVAEENEKGIYINLPVEEYPESLVLDDIDLNEESECIFDFIKLILKSFNESKPCYNIFGELTTNDKIHLLHFGYYLFSSLPDFESEQDPYDYAQLFQSGSIVEGLATVVKILQSNEKQLDVLKLRKLIQKLFYSCTIFMTNPNTITLFTNSKAIQYIYKIVTGYKISHQFTASILSLYQKGLKQILKAANRSAQFQTPLLFEKLIQSYLTDRSDRTENSIQLPHQLQQQRKLNKLIEIFIHENPTNEPVLRKIIINRIEKISASLQQNTNNNSDKNNLLPETEKLLDLINSKSLKADPEFSKKIIQFFVSRFNLLKFSDLQSFVIPYLNRDIIMNSKTFQTYVQECLELFKNQQFINSFTIQNLTKPITGQTFIKLFNNLYFIVNFIKHQQKDTAVIYAKLHQKIFQLLLALQQQQIKNIESVKSHLLKLTPNELSSFRLQQSKHFLLDQISLIDYLDTVKYIFNTTLENLLIPYAKSTPPTPAKVPVHSFVKQFKPVIQAISESNNKFQIVRYVGLLDNIINSQKVNMSVQVYFYFYIEYFKNVLEISSKLFEKSKDQKKFIRGSHLPKKINLIELISFAEASAKEQEQIEEYEFKAAITQFIDAFVLKHLIASPWVAQNTPDEPKYNNTKNLGLRLILEQFKLVQENLNEENIILYEEIIKEFLTPNIQKSHLVEQGANDTQKRGTNLRTQRQVLDVLFSMGYSYPIAEMAINQIQQLSIEGALEWLSDHHGELDTLQQEMILNQARQKSLSKQKSSGKGQSKYGLQEIELDKFNHQYMIPLRQLFSKHLLPGLYGKYSKKMPQLIIHCIQRFDKQESKNKNYKNLINYLIKEINLELEQLEKTSQMNNKKLSVQLSNLQMIIQKCITKNDIRDQALESNLIQYLLVLSDYFLKRPLVLVTEENKEQIEEQKDVYSNVINIFNILYSLIPKKTTVNIKVQLDSIVDKIIPLKQKYKSSDINKTFWSIISIRLDFDTSLPKLNTILNILFDDIQNQNIQPNFGDIIQTILNKDSSFVQANMESQIKSYFYSETESKIQSKSIKEYFAYFEKYANNQIFNKTTKRLIKKKTEKLPNNRKIVYVIYSKEKESYTDSVFLGKPFIKYTPTQPQELIISKIHKSFTDPTPKTKTTYKAKIDLLHRILCNYPLLQHHLLNKKRQQSTLLELIVNQIPQYQSSFDKIFMELGSKSGVLINQKGKPVHYSYYLQYQILQIVGQILTKQQPNHDSTHLSLSYLLSFAHFNKLSRQNISQTLPSLKSILQNNYTTGNEFINQPLVLIYKQMTFDAISGLYQLMDPENLSVLESQFIYLPLIYSLVSDDASLGRNIKLLRNQITNQLDDIRQAHDLLHQLTRIERTEGNVTRLIELFRRNQSGIESSIDFLPIQPKSERKQSKVSNAGQVDKNVVQVKQQEPKEQKTRYLNQQFDLIPILESEIKEEEQQAESTQKPAFTKFKTTSNPAPVRQFKVTYVSKFNELFINRVNSLWKLLDKSEKQQIQQDKNIKTSKTNDVQLPSITFSSGGSRLQLQSTINAEGINLNNIVRRQINERISIQQRQRNNMLFQFSARRRQSNQPAQPQFNQSQLDAILQEYVEEKPKEEPKIEKVEEKEKKQIQKVEVKQQVQPKKQELPKQVQKVEENPTINTQNKEVEVQKTEQKPQEKQEQKQVQKQEQKQQQKPQKKPEEKQQNKQQKQKQQEKKEQKQKQEVEKKEEQKKQEQSNVQTSPEVAVVPAPAPAPPAPLAPPRYRQLLQLIGVSQHFLRNNGVDEAQFDSWSEQIQTQTLFQLISMQNQHTQESKSQQPHQHIEQDVLQNIPAEIRNQIGFGMLSETELLLASIDDQEMREQIFLQASQQIISTLPLQLQAQAETIRSRRVREIAAEQEQDYNNNINMRRRPRRNKQNLIYPTVPKQLFKPIDEKILFKIIQTLFYKSKTSNTALLQSCLQNKQNQQVLINTLIYILRNPFKCPQFPNQIKSTLNQPIQSNNSKDLTNLILSILLKIILKSPYKDVNFLKQKIGYKGLLDIKLPPNKDILIQNVVTEQSHEPYVELLIYSLESNLSLSAYLLQGYKPAIIPKIILDKIIQTFKNQDLPNDYIKSLKSVSDSKELKQLFKETFTEKSPARVQLLAQILKYQFSRVDYLKELHLKILKNYKPEYNKFLNQIYRIYTLDQLHNIKNQLEAYKGVHKLVIKDLINSSNIFQQPISIILKLPFLIDFETKRQIFYQKASTWNDQGGYVGRLELRIDRLNLFAGSFSQIYPRTKEQMRGKLNVTFEDEGAYDAGGLTRQWFLIVSKEMFNPNYALFQQSSSGNTYHPSSKSYVNPDHLRYFKFIGRIAGKALMQKCLIDAYFTRSFYKLILGQPLTLSDMQSSDFNFYTSMKWIKQNKIEDDFYRFAYDIQNFGKIQTIELVPDGKNIQVTESNKYEFVQKICEVKMRIQTQEQIKSFLEGFHQLIPLESIQYFTAQELELLMSGLPEIDVKDLKTNTDYQGYQPTDKQIIWFWEILQTFDQTQLANFVQFVTGTSKVPPEGFKHLKGMHGPQKVSIHKHFSVNQLPQTHTCFNQLDLPEYPTKQVMEKMLKTALKWGSESFGFM